MPPDGDVFKVCRGHPAIGLQRSDPHADGARRGRGARGRARCRRRRLPRQAVRLSRADGPPARAHPPRPRAGPPERLRSSAASPSKPAADGCQCQRSEELLRAKEYALLEYLARRAGDVVGRADIAEHVWDETTTRSRTSSTCTCSACAGRSIAPDTSRSSAPDAERATSWWSGREMKGVSLRVRLTLLCVGVVLAVVMLFAGACTHHAVEHQHATHRSGARQQPVATVHDAAGGAGRARHAAAGGGRGVRE